MPAEQWQDTLKNLSTSLAHLISQGFILIIFNNIEKSIIFNKNFRNNNKPKKDGLTLSLLCCCLAVLARFGKIGICY